MLEFGWGIWQITSNFCITNTQLQWYRKVYNFGISLQGLPQWIEILFKEKKLVSRLQFQFQGGFVGQECVFEFFTEIPGRDKTPDFIFEDFYPEDVNSLQTYTLKSPINTKMIRIIFKSSTDTYGRVIIYKLSFLDDIK